ncbi:MAG TPA: Fic family protein [Candidatus Dormibacteraeota bacterium]|nr:Fic family protein [Candidatus Dormibacteraeota bacterium]
MAESDPSVEVPGPREITAEDLRRADAQYEPFPSASDWTEVSTDVVLWDQRVSRLTEVKPLVSKGALDSATQAILRMAAVDTGAIEGLYQVDRGITYSVAFQHAGWEFEMDKLGAQVRPLFEAQLQAHEMVLDAATRNAPLSEVFVRQLHEALTGPQETYVVYTPSGRQEQPLPRGEYKTQPNHPWDERGLRHAYAPVIDTAPEMERFIQEARSAEFEALHPAVQAAYLHYAFVCIHPFADGNGRVARALASIPLLRTASIPLMVFADEKPRYLDALADADGRNYQPFADFVFERAAAAIRRVAETILASRAPQIEGTLQGLAHLAEFVPGVSFSDLDSALGVLREATVAEVQLQLNGLDLPANAGWNQTSMLDQTSIPADFRLARTPQVASYLFRLETQPPGQAAVQRTFDFWVSKVRNIHRTFAIRLRESGDVYEFGLSDGLPEISIDARHRIQILLRGTIADAADQLYRNADSALRAQGLIP